MTSEQREAITRILRTYVEFPDDYKFDVAYDNDHISGALYRLFVDNIITAEELSREIKVFTGVKVSPHMLKCAAQDIFISMTKGGKSNE